MEKQKLINYAIWTALYMLLLGLGYGFWHTQQQISAKYANEKSRNILAGNDRIRWENTDKGVVVKELHPLLESYQKNQKKQDQIKVGDRLKRLDYQEIYKKETLDTISVSSNCDHIFIYEVERLNEETFNKEVNRIFGENTYYLTFLFNDIATFWRLHTWLLGIGFFITLLILFILFPLLQKNVSENKILLSLNFSALFFFGLQLFHLLKLLIINTREDWVDTHFEKIFIFLYVCFACIYLIQYVWFESQVQHKLLIVPSLVAAFMLAGFAYYHLFVIQHIKHFHSLFENAVLCFFFIHLIIANAFLLLRKESDSFSFLFFNILTLGISVWGTYQTGIQLFQSEPITHENILFGFAILQFYPVLNAASLRLKFGKVSLVLGRTIQYLIFFAVCLFSYLLVKQGLITLLPLNPYREIMEVLATIVLVISLRALYLANENRIRKYFILSQQEKEDNIRAFIAQIPQYTSPDKLIEEMKARLAAYLNSPNIELWWQGDMLTSEVEGENWQKIYTYLAQNQAIWSMNKELSNVTFPDSLENEAQDSNFALLSPLSINDNNFGILLLGKKRNGVYNLSDLETIAQVNQQIRLTMNVLQLVQREKLLMKETYQANLTALRSQINPHFLFNTLNTIAALIHDSPNLAEQAVEKLAYIFRYTLKTAGQEMVPLASEMKLVQTYLEIEKIRFGDRLEVQIEMSKEVENIELPAFVLQTLVENCIKHGIAKIVGKGIVSIDAYLESEQLVLEVYDNGPGILTVHVRKGTGLNNIIARLENIYQLSNLIHFENTGNGTLVTINIPINRNV